MIPVQIGEKKIEYRGIKFYKCGIYFQDSRKKLDYRRLHQQVYFDFFGEIPKGFHVHHKDEDVSNNHPSNLCLMAAGSHMTLHEMSRSDDYIKNRISHMNTIRPMTKEWHKSEYGAKWHSEHYQNTKDRLHVKSIEKCSQCGVEFETILRIKESGIRFCSKNCKSKHRRDSGVDNENRSCARCGSIFSINKYSKTKNCSRACSKGKNF